MLLDPGTEHPCRGINQGRPLQRAFVGIVRDMLDQPHRGAEGRSGIRDREALHVDQVRILRQPVPHGNVGDEGMPEFIYVFSRARKAHGDKVILDDVTLSFLPGAKIGVVGPNGAGKSTVLKIMAGLDSRPTVRRG
jgi:ABC-type multidrug transport system fused ATPase/permease subunit